MSYDNYTFYAHKPDSSDHCCGCSNIHYSSGSIFQFQLSEREVIFLLTRCFITNKMLCQQEKGFENITILNHGNPIRSEWQKTLEQEAYKIADEIVQEVQRLKEVEQAAKRAQQQQESEEMGRILVEALFKEPKHDEPTD